MGMKMAAYLLYLKRNTIWTHCFVHFNLCACYVQSASVPCQGTHVLCRLDASNVSLCGGFEDVRLEVLSLLFQRLFKECGVFKSHSKSCWPGAISIFELFLPCLSCWGVPHVVCSCFQAPKVCVYIGTAQAFIVLRSKVGENSTHKCFWSSCALGLNSALQRRPNAEVPYPSLAVSLRIALGYLGLDNHHCKMLPSWKISRGKC